MSLAQVLEPGIHVARHGFVIDQTFFDQTAQNRDFFDDVPASAALYLDPDGTPRDVGTVFTNPDLARTYERIAHLGAKGSTAAPSPTRWSRRFGVPDRRDREPRVATGRDDHARSAHVCRARARTDTRDVSRQRHLLDGTAVERRLDRRRGAEHPRGLRPLRNARADALHYFLEASRYAFADRNTYLADPAYFDVPLAGLLSKQYAGTRRALITGTAATSPVAPGDPRPFNAGSASLTALQSETTTHLTTSDKWGNVVSYTFTIESTGGSGLVVPGFGFLLNNELTDFNFDSPTHPNRVEGGKRPRSSMSPTIVLRDGKPFVALGSPGGSMIITTVLQLLVDRIDLGLTLPAAIADPRASQRNTATTSAEPAFIAGPDATALSGRGHRFTSTPEIGAATGDRVPRRRGVLAAAEPVRRGGGGAMVESP